MNQKGNTALLKDMEKEFWDTMLDNIPDAVYILNAEGKYIYVNSNYVQLLGIPKSELINFNVHSFLETGQIDICISDIVFRERRRVIAFQDFREKNTLKKTKHFLIISSPVFDENQTVKNIIAVVRSITTMNDYYHQALLNGVLSNVTIESEPPITEIVAKSHVMIELLKTARLVAETDSSVLITGESGTGKEIIAKYIHNSCPRKLKNFVVINCAALPDALIEAELFGYEKGAYTGASNSGKKGLFDEADGGTIFLDEINSLPYSLQGKILRVIETKTVRRIGSTWTRPVDVRIIAATNEDILTMIEEKRFRSDLYYRLNVIPMRIPPLRERPEDIIPLALNFLKYFCTKFNKNKLFANYSLDILHQYDWPGNVRELRNFIERIIITTRSDFIEISNIETITQNTHTVKQQKKSNAQAYSFLQQHNYIDMLQNNITLKDFLEKCEEAYIRQALELSKSTYFAAKLLGTSQSSVMRRKVKYNIGLFSKPE